MLRSAIRQILFSQPVKPIVSINGTQGLALDAAGGTLVDGRTSTATYIDADGLVQTAAANALVFENSALRHEAAATNLVRYSKDYTNVAWGKTRVTVTANSIASPSGAVDASKLEQNAVGGGAALAQSALISTIGNAYTASRWYKAGTTGWAMFNLVDNTTTTNGSRQWFNLSTGEVGSLITLGTGAAGRNAQITAGPDGWYKCQLTITANDTLMFFGSYSTNADAVFAGAVGDNIYAWESQYESGEYASSNIPTTVAATTRATDSLSLPVVQDTNLYQAQGITLIKLKMKFANSASNKSILAINTGATDFIYDNGSGGIALADGTNTATAAVGGWAIDDTLLIAACRNSRNGLMSVHVSKNGGAWVDSTDTIYDGSVSAGANLLLASGNTDSIEFNAVKLYKTNKSFAAMQRWIKSRAAQETS